jgi:hypothetical protein
VGHVYKRYLLNKEKGRLLIYQNIRCDLQQTGCVNVDWINLAQEGTVSSYYEKSNEPSGFIQDGEFLVQLSHDRTVKESAPWTWFHKMDQHQVHSGKIYSQKYNVTNRTYIYVSYYFVFIYTDTQAILIFSVNFRTDPELCSSYNRPIKFQTVNTHIAI